MTTTLSRQKLDYSDHGTPLQAHIARTEEGGKSKPAVLVFHAWRGQDDFARNKAEELAQLGYVGFAADIFGKGVFAKTDAEASQAIQPFLKDRALLKSRLQAAFETVKKLPDVDPTRIAAIGFCFGGLCALDFARSGLDIKGVVSFHGILGAPDLPRERVLARVLALHGHNDPMATPDQVLGFEKEMTQLEVDWQVHVYGNTSHAFMNPQANNPAAGLIYQPLSAKRAWTAMKNFLTEVLEH